MVVYQHPHLLGLPSPSIQGSPLTLPLHTPHPSWSPTHTTTPINCQPAFPSGVPRTALPKLPLPSPPQAHPFSLHYLTISHTFTSQTILHALDYFYFRPATWPDTPGVSDTDSPARSNPLLCPFSIRTTRYLSLQYNLDRGEVEQCRC